jgi:hypothetical protein
MSSKSRLPAPKVLQSLVEWTFPRAHRYWDDCGKLVAAIERSFSGLACQGLFQDGFRFVGQSKGVTAALFYWEKANIAQVGRGDAGLADAARQFWPLVKEGLSVTSTKRIGHRSTLCYETASPEDAIRFADGLTLVELSEPRQSLLGTPVVAGTVLRTLLEVGGRRMRLEVNPGTMTVDGRPHHGLLVDVDISLEADIPQTPSDTADFVAWNVQFLRESVSPLFRSR